MHLKNIFGHLPIALYTRYPIVARRAWPTGCIGRVRRASKGILHTTDCDAHPIFKNKLDAVFDLAYTKSGNIPYV